MTNTDIIISEAVANGLYTMEQIENILAGGHMIPLHTFQAWKSFGYTVKKENTLGLLQSFGDSRTRQRKMRTWTETRTERTTTIITLQRHFFLPPTKWKN